jgi:Leucine-rich repeat (LRR) protein
LLCGFPIGKDLQHKDGPADKQNDIGDNLTNNDLIDLNRTINRIKKKLLPEQFDALIAMAQENDLDGGQIFYSLKAKDGYVVSLSTRGLMKTISQISKFEKLKKLELIDADLTDISALEKLVSLEDLCLLRNVPLTNIFPIKSLIMLKKLDLRATFVQDIRPLRDLTNLEEFLCSEEVKDISVFSHLINLRVLDINEVDTSDISPLYGLNKLRKLSIISEICSRIPPEQLIVLKQKNPKLQIIQ